MEPFQPKVDGVRALLKMNTEHTGISITSRTGKEHQHFTHIKNSSYPFFKANPNIILDGELYIHSLEDEGKKRAEIDKTRRWNIIVSICSSSRKIAHQNEGLIKFYVFDLFDPENRLTQKQRFEILEELYINDELEMVMMPTKLVHSEKEINDALEKWTSEGYEGVIIRDLNAKYLQGPARSRFMLKHKYQDTDEFIIIGAKEGNGTKKGCVVWICKTEEGKEFRCSPKETDAVRKKLMKNYFHYQINSKNGIN